MLFIAIGSDQVSSAMTKFEAIDMPVYGPQPRPSPGTQCARAAVSSLPGSSVSTDGLSAVSGQTQVTANDPVGDTSVANLRQNGFSSEETSSSVLVKLHSDPLIVWIEAWLFLVYTVCFKSQNFVADCQ